MYKSQIFRLRERRKRNWPKLKGVSPLSKCSSTANTFWELRISGLKILHACPAYSQLLGGSLRCLLSKWPINGQRGRMCQRGKTSIRSVSLFYALEEYFQAILRTIRRRMKSLMDVTDKYRYHCSISNIVLNHCLPVLAIYSLGWACWLGSTRVLEMMDQNWECQEIPGGMVLSRSSGSKL